MAQDQDKKYQKELKTVGTIKERVRSVIENNMGPYAKYSNSPEGLKAWKKLTRAERDAMASQHEKDLQSRSKVKVKENVVGGDTFKQRYKDNAMKPQGPKKEGKILAFQKPPKPRNDKVTSSTLVKDPREETEPTLADKYAEALGIMNAAQKTGLNSELVDTQKESAALKSIQKITTSPEFKKMKADRERRNKEQDEALRKIHSDRLKSGVLDRDYGRYKGK